MSDPHVLVKIWHDGVLRWKPKVRYLGGESSVVQIEADKMSFFELKDYVLEKSSYKNKDFSMFYLKPGHKLDVGLVELENDADVNNMMVVLGDDIRHMLHLYIQGPENKDSHPSPLKLTQPVAQKEARPTPKPNPSNTIIAVTNTPPTTSTDHQSSDDEYVEEQIEDDNPIGSGGETDDEEYQASLRNRIKFNESQQLEHTELVSKILCEVTPPPNEAESQESEYEESDGDVLSPGESEDDNIRGNKHKNYTPVVTELTDWTKWKWVVGTRFENREGFKNALKNYAIYNGRNVKVTTSNKNRGSRLGATCVPPCPFKVYASYNEKIGSFMVKSVIGKHTCQRSMSKNRQFSCSYLANAFLPVFNANPNWPAKDIQDAVKEKFKMIISRWQAYNAKKVAHQKLHGSMLDHYSRLGSYIAALKEANPESTFVLSTVPSSYYGSDSGREVFFRFFVCFDGLRKGFLAGCRKLLCLDGCFLKTFLGGILLAAIGRDANDQMFPLAWAVVEGENNESWSWFMSELKVCIGVVDDGENWTLISDQQKGLLNAVALHWGRAEHRNCARHIYANWHKQHIC